MSGHCSRLWLAIRFPDLPLTSLKIDGSAEKPVVVIQKKRVVFANALAEEVGAQIHMDTTTAQLVSGCEPVGLTPIQHLRNLVTQGKQQRWPEGVAQSTEELLEKELVLIEELEYEYYFLTVHDIVRFAREQNILCQGRGSAANIRVVISCN